MATHNSRAVIQYTLDKKRINSFPSIKLASEFTKTGASGIGSVCKGKRKTAGGYIWEYDDNFSVEEYYNYLILQGGKRHPIYKDYIIFSDGKIFGTNGKFLKYSEDDQGYMSVTLCVKSRKYLKVHRLVAQTFIPNPNPETLIEVNHKNGNVFDNYVENLEWASGTGNMLHAYSQNIARRSFKPVNQFTKKGKFVKKFGSLKEAANAMGVGKGSMCDACRGKYKTCKGYVFEYAEDKQLKDNKDELWKSIEGCLGYEVSNLGRIFSCKTNHVMKIHSRKSGHKVITIGKKSYQVHRLVAKAFVPNNNPKFTKVSRIDKNKSNVCASNLKWI